MSLHVVTRDKLIPLLEDLNEPGSLRNLAAQKVVETAQECSKSPFGNGSTMEEEILLPPFVRLGIGVRIVEIAEGLEPRITTWDCFNYEIGLGIAYGDIPEIALRSESIWWDQIIPAYVTFGYSATTQG